MIINALTSILGGPKLTSTSYYFMILLWEYKQTKKE